MIKRNNKEEDANSVPLPIAIGKETGVKVWQEDVTIPTYEIGKAEKNPIFLEKRVYQGSSGAVYPYPVIEKIADEKTDKVYHAVFIENEYIKVMILPELGGRVQMAFDKIKQRHFIYYNQVIKPALVGLTGPWISGGIEFNWPQHHRPSTFLPVDYTIEHNADGSATVWVSEMEKMFHQKGMAGFTLRPGKAVLEITGKLYNRTPFPQTFLWWANPAVAVNDYYQSVFPPDVHAVFDHGKRDVSTFPIATGTYYKIDYSAGVDISNYKNIPVPTSYMAINSEFNFVGGYENDTRAGVLHVANHHVSPGKKQWTWGNGDFGKAWDRNLTDEDGPYIELMAGVYTDNQPDFSWMQPYEEKTFTQYFLPYRELGVVKNASQDILLNMDKVGDKAIVKVFATSLQKNARIHLTTGPSPRGVGENPLDFAEIIDLSPELVYEREIFVGDIPFSDLQLTVFAENGREMLSVKSEKQEKRPTPEAAKPAFSPEETQTCEQLYLTGLHLEQYRHATYNATDYYLEALKRDASDVRNNNAMGLWLLRRGKFGEAEKYFRTSIETQLQRNPNPYDGEPHYNLGLSLKFQEKNKEAYDAFYKSCWNAAMQDAGYFSCAQISCINDNLTEALAEVDKSLIRNWHNHKARALKTSILRKLDREKEALTFIEDSLKIDLFNFGCRFEQYLISKEEAVLSEMHRLMRAEIHNYEVIALDYIAAGCYWEAVQLLEAGAKVCPTTPMTYYYMGWSLYLDGKPCGSDFAKAAAHSPEYCFPNRLEAVLVLECAQKINPADAKAPYYLGNLWYDKRQYSEAIACWEKSAEIDDTFPTVLRNLSLAYFNKADKPEKALEYLEKAFALETTDSRILMELDQLYKRLCRPHTQRLAFLEKHLDLVEQRDDVYLEYVTLYNQTGNYRKAKELLKARIFHPWEGGEGKVPAQYQICRVELAKICLAKKDFTGAIELLSECFEYPHNLGEGKLYGAQENDFNYFMGCAYEGLGLMEEAKKYLELAKDGSSEPAAAIFYNDQKPDKIFYQGLALLKLNRREEAKIRFDALIAFGNKHLNESIKLDYFAVSLPDLLIWDDDLTFRNKIHCNYMLGLGFLGLGETEKGNTYLNEAARMDINHLGVQIHSQVVVGAVLGIGLVRGVREVKFKVLGNIAIGWLLTPLLSGIFTFFSLFFVSSVFGISVTKAKAIGGVNPEPATLNTIVNIPVEFNPPTIIIIVSLLVIFVTLLFFKYKKNKSKLRENERRWVEQLQFAEFQKALNDIEVSTIHLENDTLASRLEEKRRELVTYSLNIGEQRQLLASIVKTLENAIHETDINGKNTLLNEEIKRLKQKMSFTSEAEKIYFEAEQVHNDFSSRLTLKFPNLTPQEKRLLVLLRIGLSSKEISPILNISPKSVEINRHRLRKKLNLNKDENLIQFIKSM